MIESPLFEVIYEDNHLLVVNKAAGVLTQPTDLESESLENLLKKWLKDKYQKPGNVFLGVTHRLDRPVSGIVVFAKTSKALSRLNSSMRAREMSKTYHALVEGKPPKDADTLIHYLRHDEYRAEICLQTHPEAKKAILHYKTLEKREKTTLLEVKLETGRYHQIRAQLSAIGCPIVGDSKYGAKTKMPPHTIALKHVRMEIVHPVTQEVMVFETPT